MLRRVATLLALLLVVFSCSASKPADDCDFEPNVSAKPAQTIEVYKLIFNTSIPAAKVGPILDAAAEWQTVTKGAFVFTVEYRSFDAAEKSAMGEMRVWLGPKPDPNSTRIGSTTWWDTDENGRPGRSRIWIENDLADHTHYLVALHEIGHALGLAHSSSKASIMYPAVQDIGEHVPCMDKESVCQIWECTAVCQ